ncbi:hypothetical protein EJ06DRAFT_369067 [Trichodelitschia bisporula]|uniref:Uncharacterized protein n=1 Tax=Trichodelitschia bisporula TaxID=703511 RepID=A0A6G1I1I8_9PEZI|nr:hypothetical protein EJ06DRAFT_369067 [Trichodelitschia bisporula]
MGINGTTEHHEAHLHYLLAAGLLFGVFWLCGVVWLSMRNPRNVVAFRLLGCYVIFLASFALIICFGEMGGVESSELRRDIPPDAADDWNLTAEWQTKFGELYLTLSCRIILLRRISLNGGRCYPALPYGLSESLTFSVSSAAHFFTRPSGHFPTGGTPQSRNIPRSLATKPDARLRLRHGDAAARALRLKLKRVNQRPAPPSLVVENEIGAFRDTLRP